MPKHRLEPFLSHVMAQQLTAAECDSTFRVKTAAAEALPDSADQLTKALCRAISAEVNIWKNVVENAYFTVKEMYDRHARSNGAQG